ncbi:MAG: transcription termination/antitermination protein NusA [Clostridia bacterium]|nr:transcription termination/antitermination protein NusA [Clostridia bacterium]
MKKNKEPEENLFEALALIEKEKGIPADFMVAQITKAIVTACKNSYGGNDDVTIQYNKSSGRLEVSLNKTVVEEVTDINREISVAEAKKIKLTAVPGEKVGIKLDPKSFGRIAVMTARNMIRQGIRDGEKEQALSEYQSKLQDIVTATVEQVDPATGNATLKLGKTIAILQKNDQVPGEILNVGDLIKVYVVNVKITDRGPRAIISRTHPDLVKRLFEEQVPEIFDGIVEIKSISREAGSRTKIAVFSKDSEVDAVGACIGPKGQRVGTIVSQLGGEKIDIIEYSEDPVEFIKKALSPADVIDVSLDPKGEKICKATVPDSQLSLAIGNKGQNVRLAAKLTNWKIDIRPESGFFGEDDEEDKKDEYIGDGLDDTEETAAEEENAEAETSEAVPSEEEAVDDDTATETDEIVQTEDEAAETFSDDDVITEE